MCKHINSNRVGNKLSSLLSLHYTTIPLLYNLSFDVNKIIVTQTEEPIFEEVHVISVSALAIKGTHS